MSKIPPNDIDSAIEYLFSPLEQPEIDPSSIYKPYHSKIDDQIEEILGGYESTSDSLGLSPFTLLDSTVVIPPVIDKFKTAYYQEAIEYGDFVDIYIYERPKIIYKNPKPKSVGSSHNYELPKIDRGGEYRRRNSIKALNKIRQLTLENFNDKTVKLLTLTFGDCDLDITDPKICNKLFSKFMQKLKKLYVNLKYLGVIEFQKRGAVHYHILCDLPYLDKESLSELWKHGFIDIRKPDYVVGSYLFKYLSKDLNDEKLKGVRVYFNSRNLSKPKKSKEVRAFNLIKNLKDQNIYFANSYSNKYNGDVVRYRQFKVPPAKDNNDK